jgi:LacI family transcriptional regulator
MPRPAAPVTLKDLAEKTGVSPTAVSHVLNDRLGHVRVSEETRKRVLSAAAELGYVPRFSARAMATRRSHTIAVVCAVDDDRAPMVPAAAIYYANALLGAEDACKHVGYHCLFATCGLGDPDRFAVPRFMKDGSVDGILLVGHTAPAVVRRIQALDLPCLQVGSNIDPKTGIPTVYPDLDGGLADAARHLASLGHRRVELFLPSGPGPRRHAAAFAALAGQVPGLEPLARLLPDTRATVDQGADRARAAAADPDAPTAFICSPLHADGLTAGFESLGLQAPRDYSLVLLRPEEAGPHRVGAAGRVATAVTFPIRAVTRLGATRLFEALGVDAPAPTAAAAVPCTIVHGETTGPAPDQHRRPARL